MAQTLQERIANALSQIVNPRTGTDVMSAEMVRDIGTTTSGKVRLTLLLAPGDEPTLARHVRTMLEAVEGVTEVRVDVKDQTQEGSRIGGGGTPAAASAASKTSCTITASRRPRGWR